MSRLLGVSVVAVVTDEDEPTPTPELSANPTKVVCKDGTVSESGGKPGACAWHGGVDWSK